MLQNNINEVIQKIIDSKIAFGEKSKFSELEKYNNYYGLPSFDGFDHVFGYFACNNRKIWGHIIIPKYIKSKGTVVIIHGYQSHSGDQKYVVWHYLLQDKIVAMFDLPGHGLSDGTESCVNDFTEYVETLTEFVTCGSKYFNGEIEFFGHSQGCAILSMYVRDKKNIKLTYFAPLVRLKHYPLTIFLSYLPIEKIVGIKVNVSSNKKYNIFAKKDPLQSKIITIEWFRSVKKFYKEFMDYGKYDNSIKLIIIQGDKDIIVDWRFNIKVFKDKFDRISLIKIKGANHQLQNETMTLRQKIFYNC